MKNICVVLLLLMLFPVSSHAWQIFEPPFHNGETHSILIRVVHVDEGQAEIPDEIGVFTPDGFLAGVEYFDPEGTGLAAWGDDPDTQEIDGFREGEPFHFMIYRHDEDREYNAFAEFTEGPEVFRANALTIINLTVITQYQIVQLARGWNIISSARDFHDYFRNDDGSDMRLIVQDIEENLLFIKDMYGHFCMPAYNFWQIHLWEGAQGYLVKVDQAVELFFYGDEVPFDLPIQLEAGWNLVAYYPDFESRFEYAAETILDHVQIAKNARGNFWTPGFYFPVLIMNPGQGYQIKVDEDCELRYSADPPGDDLDAEVPYLEPSHFHAVNRTASNMSIVISALSEVEAGGISEIAVLNEHDLVCGAVSVSGLTAAGLAVFADDPLTEMVDGMQEGELMRFAGWNPQTETRIPLSALSCSSSCLNYRTDDLIFVELSAPIPEADIKLPFDPGLLHLYPNPFNPNCNIELLLNSRSNLLIELLDINGQLIKLVERGVKSAGEYRGQIYGEDLPAGMYFVRITAGVQRQTRKIILLK